MVTFIVIRDQVSSLLEVESVFLLTRVVFVGLRTFWSAWSAARGALVVGETSRGDRSFRRRLPLEFFPNLLLADGVHS